MLFEFLHHEKKCLAFVNERQSLCDQPLRIYILDCNQELGYELIFHLNDLREWSTISTLKYNHPQTYNGICEKLEGIFPSQRFPKRIIPVITQTAHYEKIS